MSERARWRMVPKSGNRFSDETMRKRTVQSRAGVE
jgi:hypothetical protein